VDPVPGSLFVSCIQGCQLLPENGNPSKAAAPDQDHPFLESNIKARNGKERDLV
jgi:hypothetical protein